jgi:hypothetical protein
LTTQPQLISREQAAAIAKDALFFTDGRGRYKVYAVRGFDGNDCRHPHIYGMSDSTFADCWIVYLQPDPYIPVICSSTIMLIAKDSGRMVYFGMAADEG